jgi:ferritin-like metal-binding protein YciE
MPHQFADLRDLLVLQLKDIYNSESQQAHEGLPKMVSRSTNPGLVKRLKNHLDDTEMQLAGLDMIASVLRVDLSGSNCAAMRGLLAEASDWMDQDAAADVMDAGIVANAQRIEQFEICAYESAYSVATILEEMACADLLRDALLEERRASEALCVASEAIFQTAVNDEISGVSSSPAGKIAFSSRARMLPRTGQNVDELILSYA